MRLFIAINFPAEIKAVMSGIRDNLKKESLHGNFSLDENLHLTLVFLGECDYAQVSAIKAVMKKITVPELKLTIEKVGYFKRDGGNTWWIGLKHNPLLSNLHNELSTLLKQNGFIIEDRKYVPHITIGREVKMHSGFTIPEIQQVEFNIKSIDLMKSERINGKLTYTQIYSSGIKN